MIENLAAADALIHPEVVDLDLYSHTDHFTEAISNVRLLPSLPPVAALEEGEGHEVFNAQRPFHIDRAEPALTNMVRVF